MLPVRALQEMKKVKKGNIVGSEDLARQSQQNLANAKNPQYGQDTSGDDSLNRLPPQMRPYVKDWQAKAEKASKDAK